jgi:hypothetical protein
MFEIYCITANTDYNYLLTYDSYGPVYNRFHRGEWITWASCGGKGALDTPGPSNGIERSQCHLDPKKSRIQGPPLQMAQVMDIACFKIMKSKGHKKTGTLVILCT